MQTSMGMGQMEASHMKLLSYIQKGLSMVYQYIKPNQKNTNRVWRRDSFRKSGSAKHGCNNILSCLAILLARTILAAHFEKQT